MERCPERKRYELALARERAELKKREDIEHFRRLKRLAGYNKTPTPSRSSSKTKKYSAWRTVIEGGAVETNPRRH